MTLVDNKVPSKNYFEPQLVKSNNSKNHQIITKNSKGQQKEEFKRSPKLSSPIGNLLVINEAVDIIVKEGHITFGDDSLFLLAAKDRLFYESLSPSTSVSSPSTDATNQFSPDLVSSIT